MAISRYDSRQLIYNEDEGYRKNLFQNRGVNRIVQYDTAQFSYPDIDDIAKLDVVTLRWNSASRLYNISNEYYGSPEYWWVIALYNQKPTEADFEIGDIFYVPRPLEDVLGMLGV